jgi:alkaline phosphatase D
MADAIRRHDEALASRSRRHCPGSGRPSGPTLSKATLQNPFTFPTIYEPSPASMILKKSSILPLFFVLGLASGVARAAPPYLANGAKTGEVDARSAIVWVRLTAMPAADFARLPIFTQGLKKNESDEGAMPVDVLPGIEGEVRISWWPEGEDDGAKRSSDWVAVAAANDFIHQFRLDELQPHTRYAYRIDTRATGAAEVANQLSGHFQTAPLADQRAPIRFIVTTCQAIRSIDSGEQGHLTYRQMLKFKPDFFVHTGDILYYDKAPLAKTVPEARAKWNLMFAYHGNRAFHQQVTSYFMKDDHDTLKNDCWPGQTYGDLTFQQGLEIFREQVPMGEKTYRTYRWGRDVQIWMTENRDFRSPNNRKDGPDKTILGNEQKQWLKRSLRESDATHKFVISPGPLVGPDKGGKNDNHANDGFRHEGQELRDYLGKLPNTYVICGDRHWQYLSKDPQTGLLELGCGPINDEHGYGGNPGRIPEYHEFFSKQGGFLGITVENGKARAEWYGTGEASSHPPVRFTRVLGE